MKQLLLALTLIIGINSYSQINYVSGNYASGNYSQQMTTVTLGLIGQNFDTTGANMTWNYSTLGMESTGNSETVSAGSSGYQTPFITQCVLAGGGFTCLGKWNNLTNLGVIDLDSLNAVVLTLYDITTLAKKSTGSLVGNIKGLKIKDTNGLTVPIVAEYDDSDTILEFPFSYQDSGSSYGAWGLDASSVGQNIQYKVTYDRKWVVEGWGKLITPYATHNNTLKIKTTLDQMDSVIYLGTPFGVPRKIVEYTWYDARYGLPVMKAEGIEVLGSTTINTVQYYDLRTVGIPSISETIKLSLFPNPTTEVINVTTSKNIAINQYQMMDGQGKLVKTGPFTQSLSVAELEPGIYFIRLIANQEVIGIEKFVKE